jgi:hypothetical protein
VAQPFLTPELAEFDGVFAETALSIGHSACTGSLALLAILLMYLLM